MCQFDWRNSRVLDLAKQGAGSLLNITGAEKANTALRVAPEHSRLKIPLDFGYDVIHGYRTVSQCPSPGQAALILN